MTRRFHLRSSSDWSLPEELVLRAAVEVCGTNQWRRIASLLPGKTALQCQEHFYSSADPSLKGGGNWTVQEDRLLLQVGRSLVGQWQTVALLLPGRTADACAQRFAELTRVLDASSQQKESLPSPGREPASVPVEQVSGLSAPARDTSALCPLPRCESRSATGRGVTLSVSDEELLRQASVRLYGDPRKLIERFLETPSTSEQGTAPASTIIADDDACDASSILFDEEHKRVQLCLELLTSQALHQRHQLSKRSAVSCWDPAVCARLLDDPAFRKRMRSLEQALCQTASTCARPENPGTPAWNAQWLELPVAISGADVERAYLETECELQQQAAQHANVSAKHCRGSRALPVAAEHRRHRAETLIREAVRELLPADTHVAVKAIPLIAPSAETEALIAEALATEDFQKWYTIVQAASSAPLASTDVPSRERT